MVNRLSRYNQFKLLADKTEWAGLSDSEPIDLPYGAKPCATGIQLPDTLQWKDVGIKLMGIDKGIQWALANW